MLGLGLPMAQAIRRITRRGRRAGLFPGCTTVDLYFPVKGATMKPGRPPERWKRILCVYAEAPLLKLTRRVLEAR